LPPEELRLEEPQAATPWSPQAVEELHVAAAEVLATNVPLAPEPEDLPLADEGPATPSQPVRDWVRAAEIEEPAAAAPAPAPQPDAESGTPDVETLRARVKKSARDYDARLALGRALLAQGETLDALKQYDVLVKASQHLKAVIEDLSRELEAHPDQAKVRRSLGDAYNHDGQFQKALELFRSALKDLKK
jgi:thioredoxin-like negative regulator of GroEL